MQRHVLTTRTTALAERRQVRIVANTEDVGRDGIILVTSGIDLTAYRRNPVVLWMHDPEQPIAKAATVETRGTDLVALVQFPPLGASPLADEKFSLIQAGIISAVSTGFEVKEAEPLDPKEPWGGQRVTKCELQEVSFVSVPALPTALVSERAHGNPGEGWHCGAAADLPIDEDRAWDGDAARERVLRLAGFDGEHPDPIRARRAFLCYDASRPLLRGSFKLPFADIVDGRLTAISRGLDAAAGMLERADIPEREKERARRIIKAYEAREPDGPQRAHRRLAALYSRELKAVAPRHTMDFHRRMARRYERDLAR